LPGQIGHGADSVELVYDWHNEYSVLQLERDAAIISPDIYDDNRITVLPVHLVVVSGAGAESRQRVHLKA